MVLKIVLGVVLLLVLAVVIILIAAMTKPNEFSYRRSMSMAAPPEVIFGHVNDLKQWDAWSPWEKFDPNMQKTYGDTVAGAGGHYSWNGNKDIGEGSLTITESKPYEQIKMDLKFVRPFACENDVYFTFEPSGDQTQVTWRMDGEATFFSKVMGVFMSMEKMCGDQFTEGLENLKKIAEEEAQRTSPGVAETTS